MAKKRHQHHEEHVDESWLIPYADLLTLLLALFIVLFASSQMDAKKFEQLSRSLNEAFTGGTGVLQFPSAVETPDAITPDPNKATTAPDTRQMNDNTEREQNTQKNTEKEQNQAQTMQEQQKQQQEQEDMRKLKESIDKYIQENQLGDTFDAQLLPDGVKIVIRDLAFFASGRADIRPETKNLAVQMSHLLAAYPRQVTVSGHTDNLPIRNADFDSNWDLSAKRAVNFMKILLENPQLIPSNFSAVGYGEYRPEVANDSDENRGKNRRVEVFIQKKK